MSAGFALECVAVDDISVILEKDEKHKGTQLYNLSTYIKTVFKEEHCF